MGIGSVRAVGSVKLVPRVEASGKPCESLVEALCNMATWDWPVSDVGKRLATLETCKVD